MSVTQKTNLLGLDHQGMKDFFESKGEKTFRATQVLQWIHQHGIVDFESMTNLSKDLRTRLSEMAHIQFPEVIYDQVSLDGTRKWLLRVSAEGTEDPRRLGNSIETVFIPEESRGTLCISSQVGCSLDCSFCATARQGFNRNLTVDEIIGQVWLAKQHLWANGKPKQDITNVVLMGMGEPLHNFKNVVTAVNLMMDDHAYGLSKRRVTLSTAGVVPAIEKLREVSEVSLAVSLHATNDELRDQLVPVNKKHPIRELLAACKRYVDGRHKRHVTFEYVMLDGVNDQPEHAYQLAKLLKDLPSKVNLIPFNPFKDAGYRCSSPQAIEKFQNIIQSKGVLATTRKTRGDDIDAACGQLVGKVNDMSRRHIKFVEPRFGMTQAH